MKAGTWISVAGWLTLSMLLSGSRTPLLKAENDSPPNIIFLLADDLRWDALGYAGHPVVKTPALDSLASRGTVFTNAFVTTSICSVSRASFLSGQYARRHGKWGFGPGFGPDQWLQTYPGQLQQAGYRTGFIGKYGVGEIQFAASTFDYWRGFPGQGSFNARDEQGNPIHLTRLIGQQAAEFIGSSEAGTPFALSVSFKAPHVEGGADNWALFDPAFAEEYEGAWFPQALSGEVEHFNHFNEAFMDRNEARLRYQNRFGNPAKAQESLEGYYRLVHGIDRAVSRMVATLQAQGLADNTIIIFTSDNGMYLGEYGFSGKWYGSDPSIRVPLFIYDPTHANTDPIRTEIALNIDIAPTILELAGIPRPPTVQGESLLPLVLDTLTAEWRSDFLYEHLWPSNSIYIPSVEGVVNDSVKYMRYFRNFDLTPIIQEELYDLRADPAEIRNLADAPEQSDLKAALSTRLEYLIKQFN